MKYTIFFLFLSVIICMPFSSFARTHITYDISPSIQYTFGKTEYILDAFGLDSTGELFHVKSQLEFPLDGVMTGGKVGLEITPANKKTLRLEAGVFITVTDPTGKMLDHDWGDIWVNTRLNSFQKVSYTESDVTMNAYLLMFEVSKQIWLSKRSAISLLAGIHYQHIEQDVIGFAGWQLDPSGDSLVYFSVPGVQGIFYRVSYLMPHVGLQGNLAPSPNTSITAKAAYSMVRVSDYDDHILRTKESYATINGNGFIGGIDFQFLLSRQKQKAWFLNINTDFLYATASGAQTQHWYGDKDEPSVSQGTTQSGIPHEINTIQLRLGLELGYHF